MPKPLKVAEVVQDDESDVIETETREERFLRIAERRTNRILGDLALIEAMAGSGNYKFERESIEAMLATLDQAVNRLRQRYELVLTRKNPAKARESFHFAKKD